MTARHALGPESWSVRDDGPGGEPVVEILCPDCQRASTLWWVERGHEIDANGTVSPSVVCPFEGCTFHRWVLLTGWTGGALPKRP